MCEHWQAIVGVTPAALRWASLSARIRVPGIGTISGTSARSATAIVRLRGAPRDGKDDHPYLGVGGDRPQVVGHRTGPHHAHVATAAAHQVGHLVITPGILHQQSHPRVQPMEPGDVAGRLHRRGADPGHAQLARHQTVDRCDRGAAALGLGDGSPGRVDERGAGLGEPGAVGRALEQTGAQLALQSGHRVRERGLGDVQRRRSGGEAAVIGDGDDAAEVVKLHGSIEALYGAWMQVSLDAKAATGSS